MDIFLAFSLVFFIFVFLALCVSRALFPVSSCLMLVLAQGTGEDLQQRLYALMWLKTLGFLHCPIYVLNDGLEEEGRILLTHLRQRWPDVVFCEQWEYPH